MLRAVLLGVLSLSAIACKSKPDTAASAQPGVAAGKVLEVKGSVSLKHADATRALASGETVEGDDTVITGADGSVVIELAHNSARWELGPNKQQKVRDSIAWNAQKATPEEIDQATAAAGRPAERNAAGTVATADEPAAEPAPAAVEPDLQPKGGPSPAPAEHAPPRRRAPAAPPKVMAPPPPPPPPAAEPAPADDEAPAPRHTRGAIKKESASASAPMAPQAAASSVAPAGPELADLLAGKASALHQCMVDNGGTSDVTLVVDMKAGKADVSVSSKSAVSAALSACIKKVVNGIQFSATAKVTRTIKP